VRTDTVAIESSYNWYWVADALRPHGCNVVLAKLARMKLYTELVGRLKTRVSYRAQALP